MRGIKGLVLAGVLLAATAAPALAGPPGPSGGPKQDRPGPVTPEGHEEGHGQGRQGTGRPEGLHEPGRPDHADAVVEAAHTRVTLTNPDGTEISVPLRAAHAMRVGFGLSDDATERLEQLFEQLDVEIPEDVLAEVEEMEAEGQHLPRILRHAIQQVLLTLLEQQEDNSGDQPDSNTEETESGSETETGSGTETATD
ncbi:MAG TPA: hypothetical protein VIO14_01540 [Dehalococcoidia bacterium]